MTLPLSVPQPVSLSAQLPAHPSGPVSWALLLGRASELAALGALVSDVLQARSAVLVVQGAAGTGKTVLLNELVRLARAGGARVLHTSGSAAPGNELRVARQLLAPAGPLPGASGVAVPHGDVCRSADELVETLCGDGPLVLVVDDAQLSDGASLRWLAALVRRLNGRPALLAVAVRSEEPAADPDALADLRHVLTAVTLSPRPLGAGHVRELVEARLGAPADPAFVAACRSATRGNPFLLTELLHELAAGQVLPTLAQARSVAAVGPLAVAQQVTAVLRRCCPIGVTVAPVLAVLEGPAAPDEVATLCDLDGTASVEVLAALARLTLVRPDGTFVHPVIAQALRLALPEDPQERAHRRVAALLAARQAPPEQVLWHLTRTPPTLDPATSDLLCRLADQAEAQGRPEVAEACLRRALPQTLSPLRRAALALKLGALLARRGSETAPAYLQHAYDALPAGEQRRRAALHLVDAVAGEDGVPAAVRTCDGLLAGLPDQGQGELAAQLRRTRSALAVLHTDTRGPVGQAESPLPIAWRGEDLQAAQVRAQAWLAAEPGGATAAVVQVSGLLPLLYADRLEALQRALQPALQVADGRGAVVPELALLRSRAALRVGEVATAERHARAALSAVAAGGARPVVLSAEAALVDTALERGDLDEGAQLLARAGLDGALPGDWWCHHVLQSRGRLRVRRGELAAGLADLRECGRRLQEWGVRNPAVSPWRSEVAVLTAPEDPAGARALVADELADARAWGTPRAVGTALHASALLQDGQRRVQLLTEAVALLGQAPAPLELARALLDLGEALGGSAESREPLRAGLDLAERCGATDLAGRARTALLAAGARPRRNRQSGIEALTRAERSTVDLAAGSLTNREIAQALFVTLRTVELHLTNSYRKLGISGRSDLREVLGGGPAGDAA